MSDHGSDTEAAVQAPARSPSQNGWIAKAPPLLGVQGAKPPGGVSGAEPLTLLSVRNLQVHYSTSAGAVRAVDGADLDVPAGSILGLVGESGCGKSTLGRALMGVFPGTGRIAGGSIAFEGRDLVTLPERERRALRWRRMSFVPQTAMNALDPYDACARKCWKCCARAAA